MTARTPIEVHCSNGQFFVWNVDDIKFIRKTYRLLGSFVGSTSWLGAGYQNKIHGLPLQLMVEECLFLLAECSNVRLITGRSLDERQIANYVSEFGQFEEEFVAEYRRLHRLASIEAIHGKLQRIAEGKAKKAGLTVEQVDKEQILKDEINRIKQIGLPKQLLVQSPWSAAYGEVQWRRLQSSDRHALGSGELANRSANDARTDTMREEERQNELEKAIESVLGNEHSLLRCAVYADLNRKGLHLTGGSKFGSDFLAYPADPLFVHALYLVVCLSENQQLSKTLLHTYTRLGSQVNKHVLLVRFRTDGDKAGGDRAADKEDEDKTDFRRLDKDQLGQLASKLDYMVIKWQ